MPNHPASPDPDARHDDAARRGRDVDGRQAALVALSAIRPPEVDRRHVVSLRLGAFDSTSYADLQAIFARLREPAHRDRPIVLYFHGGNVPERGGLDVARRLQGRLWDAGAYPIFVVWQSGFLDAPAGSHDPGEAIARLLEPLVGEPLFRRALRALLRVVIGAARWARMGFVGEPLVNLVPDEVRTEEELARLGSGREPFDEEDTEPLAGDSPEPTPDELEELERLLDDDPVWRRELRYIADPPCDGQAWSRLLTPAWVRLAPAPDVDAVRVAAVQNVVDVYRRIRRRLRDRRDHGWYCTAFEELLNQWEAGDWLKGQYAGIASLPDCAFQGEEDDPADRERYGGTALLGELADHLRALDPERRPRILLVGHSGGSFYICDFLRHADVALGDPLHDVRFETVFLAPACSMELLAATLQAHAHRLAEFRMFGMGDARERDDPLCAASICELYPRSLLYLVSGLLESAADLPLVGMERFHHVPAVFTADEQRAIDAVRAFVAGGGNRAVWAPHSGGPGCSSDVRCHTAFDKDPATVGSLQHIVAHGFGCP